MNTKQSKISLRSLLWNTEKNNNIDEPIYGRIVFFIDALSKQRRAMYRKAGRLENDIAILHTILKKKSSSYSQYYKMLTTNNYLRGMHTALSQLYIQIREIDKVIHKLKQIA